MDLEKGVNGITALIVCDLPYLKYAEVCIASIKRNAPTVRIHLRAIRVPQEEVMRLIQTYGCEISEDHTDYDRLEDRRAYAANIRVLAIQYLLNRGDQYVIYFDADSIIRKDISRIIPELSKTDILIARTAYTKPVEGERAKFLSGVIACRNTNATRMFVEKWLQLITPHITEWFADQLYFSRTYDSCRDSVRVGDLPFAYIDFHFEFRSSVWVGKGNKKTENAIYLLEEQRYRKSLRKWDRIVLDMRQLFYRTVRIVWGLKQYLISKALRLREFVKG